MKICIVAPGWLPIPAIKGGAVETLITALLSENDKHGDFEFCILTPNDNMLNNIEYKHSIIIQCGMTLIQKVIKRICFIMGVELEYESFYMRNTYKYLKRKKFDRVIIENNMDLYIYLYKKLENKFKFVYHMHNDFDDIEYTKEKACFIANTAEDIWAVSKYIKERFCDETGASNVKVYKNCIDVKKFNRNNYLDFRKEFRKVNNILDEDIVLLFSGRTIPVKGIKELVQAFVELNYENVYLVVIGNHYFGSNEKNEYYEELEYLSEKKKDKILFTGKINYDEIAKYYAVSDVVVVPSIWQEAAGLVVLEAQASGNALLASQKGGIPEYCSMNSALFFNIEYGEYNDLLEKIECVCHEQSIITQMVEQGQNFVKEYNYTTYYKQFCKMLS